MKKVTCFYMNGCPYCRNANKAYEEILYDHPEYKAIEIKKINEVQEAALADTYDYYYVPTFYVDDKKVYECSPKDNYDVIKQHVEAVLKSAFNQ